MSFKSRVKGRGSDRWQERCNVLLVCSYQNWHKTNVDLRSHFSTTSRGLTRDSVHNDWLWECRRACSKVSLKGGEAWSVNNSSSATSTIPEWNNFKNYIIDLILKKILNYATAADHCDVESRADARETDWTERESRESEVACLLHSTANWETHKHTDINTRQETENSSMGEHLRGKRIWAILARQMGRRDVAAINARLGRTLYQNQS